MRVADAQDCEMIQRLLEDEDIRVGADLMGKGVTPEYLWDAGCTILLDDHGCFVLKPLSATQVDVHTLFEKGFRGAYASACVKESLLWLFTSTDINQVFTKVSHRQKAVKLFTCAMGFSRYDEDEQFTYYKLDLLDWIKQSPELQEEGQRFHAMLGPDHQTHEEMPFHDKMVGFASKCIQAGLVFRGVGIYNPIAETHEWAPLVVKSVKPLTLVCDDLTLEVHGSRFEVVEDVCQ